MENPYAPPTADISRQDTSSEMDFYTVGPLKFALMAVTTFGLFVVFWFYKNWNVIRLRENEAIWPFWRAVFGAFWSFAMGRRFHAYAAKQVFVLDFPHVLLGVGLLISGAASNAPDPLWVLSFGAFLFVIPFDTAARRLNGGGQLAAPTRGRFSVLNIVWILIGSIFFLLAMIGLAMDASA